MFARTLPADSRERAADIAAELHYQDLILGKDYGTTEVGGSEHPQEKEKNSKGDKEV